MEVKNLNIGVLAFLGDAIYEQKIREHLVNKGIMKVDLLQKESIKYVSANSQSKILKRLIDNNVLNDKEMSLVLRARNYKSKSKPRYADIITYKHATALEALVGSLYYLDKERFNIIMNYIIEE